MQLPTPVLFFLAALCFPCPRGKRPGSHTPRLLEKQGIPQRHAKWRTPPTNAQTPTRDAEVPAQTVSSPAAGPTSISTATVPFLIPVIHIEPSGALRLCPVSWPAGNHLHRASGRRSCCVGYTRLLSQSGTILLGD